MYLSSDDHENYIGIKDGTDMSGSYRYMSHETIPMLFYVQLYKVFLLSILHPLSCFRRYLSTHNHHSNPFNTNHELGTHCLFFYGTEVSTQVHDREA